MSVVISRDKTAIAHTYKAFFKKKKKTLIAYNFFLQKLRHNIDNTVNVTAEP